MESFATPSSVTALPPGDISRFRGCLLGGAVGDALGAPTEFMSLAEIVGRFGPKGVSRMEPQYGRIGAITDDTQMTLFTAEGLLRAVNRMHKTGAPDTVEVVYRAYLRWLQTQQSAYSSSSDEDDGWLIGISDLHHRRAPGNTCMSALLSGRIGATDAPINDSKGCGGIMRAAPAGLVSLSVNPFDLGVLTAAITHDHPSGYLAAGFLSAVVADLVSARTLKDAIARATERLSREPEADECLSAVEQAVALSQARTPAREAIEELGEGWVAEEALSISLFCALYANGDFSRGVLAAVNHDGDTDSTGAITGNMLGAMLGEEAIPEDWLAGLELGSVIGSVANDLHRGYEDTEAWSEKYPPT